MCSSVPVSKFFRFLAHAGFEFAIFGAPFHLSGNKMFGGGASCKPRTMGRNAHSQLVWRGLHERGIGAAHPFYDARRRP